MGTRRLLVAFLSTISILGFSGCAKASFSASKSQVLENQSVFNPDGADSDQASGGINQPADNGHGGASGGILQDILDSFGSINQTIHSNPPTSDTVRLVLKCSDSGSHKDTNFKKVVADNGSAQLKIGPQVCTGNLQQLAQLVDKKSVTVADIQRLCPSLAPSNGALADVSFVIDGTPYASIAGVLPLLYANNHDTSNPETAADDRCDQSSSPLVIHFQSGRDVARPIALSSPRDGILFDLLGALNNHRKVRISWFTNSEYALLALPDANGRVDSIDQLFGNATLGPDGLFADNGYEALAKYDGASADGRFRLAAADGRIDRRDPVFSRLRLWVDKNFDGQAQADELISLASARIAYVDLDYSNKYQEVDKYGNVTQMKSVVGYTNGSLDLIFDLWFAFQF